MRDIRHPNSLNKRRDSSSNMVLDLFVTLAMCVGVLLIVVSYINYQKLISIAEDSISAVEKSNDELRSLIANQQRRQEALKNEKVIEYAKAHKMVMPSPGQVCVITEEQRSHAPVLKSYRQKETRVASLPAPFLNYAQTP